MVGAKTKFSFGDYEMEDAVAIVVDANTPALIVPRTEATDLLKFYSGYVLLHESDQQLFTALQLSLGGDFETKPGLDYVAGEETTAERKIREWKALQENV